MIPYSAGFYHVTARTYPKDPKTHSFKTPLDLLYSDELYPNPKLLNLKAFSVFDTEVGIETTGSRYINKKGVNYVYYKAYLNVINSYSHGSLPFSYIQVLDTFRGPPKRAVFTH